MAKKRTQYKVSAREFIEAWERSETAQEVCDKVGMPKAIVLARASAYRKDGIPLKKMKRRSSRALDVEELKKLVLDIRKEQETKGRQKGK